MQTVWGQYPDTILTFPALGGLQIDLRRPVTDVHIAALATLGLRPEYGIVTACDPMGVNHEPDVNRVRTHMLQMEIESLAASHSLVEACSVDGSHCEASFAVAADLTVVTALATRYDQLGIFWFDGISFWIIPARSNNARLRLPVARG